MITINQSEASIHLDGLVTASTEAAPEAVVVSLAVGKALMFIKLPPSKWLPTLLADEAVRMPLKTGWMMLFCARILLERMSELF